MLAKPALSVLPLILCLRHSWSLWLVMLWEDHHLASLTRLKPAALPPQPLLLPLRPSPRPLFLPYAFPPLRFVSSLFCGHSFL